MLGQCDDPSCRSIHFAPSRHFSAQVQTVWTVQTVLCSIYFVAEYGLWILVLVNLDKSCQHQNINIHKTSHSRSRGMLPQHSGIQPNPWKYILDTPQVLPCSYILRDKNITIDRNDLGPSTPIPCCWAPDSRLYNVGNRYLLYGNVIQTSTLCNRNKTIGRVCNLMSFQMVF